MFDSFTKQSKLVKCLLLIIPFVNWIVELLTRFDFYSKKKDNASLIIAILSIFFGALFGFIDFVCVLLTNKQFLTE